jgi:N-acetylmuramic acid 6-phosphate etherase
LENNILFITEKNNHLTYNIDVKNGEEIAGLINNEDQKVAQAIDKIVPQIGRTIDKVAELLQNGGRMAYFGCGTSGRIGILDASEMVPTFGVMPDLIKAYIAGGENAIRSSAENAEDSEDLALADLGDFNPTKKDVVVGISASGNPAYVVKVLQEAQARGAFVVAICSNPEAKAAKFADIFLNPQVGPEVITGSSRMKSGTAQKMILNMLSTGVMIKLGKTYHNYMVDVHLSNDKLRKRALRFVCEITGADEQTAQNALEKGQSVKTACVMLKLKLNKEQAEKLLDRHNGILRKVIG